MKVRGEAHLGRYHALIREPGKRARRSKAERRFCKECGSALWLWDPTLARADPSARLGDRHAAAEAARGRRGGARLHAAPWVDVPRGKGHVHSRREWPERIARGLAQAPSSLERVTAARRLPRAAASGAAGRPPKIAVPTRTIVAPSAIAASRSALMPIDSVSSARPSRAQRVEAARAARGAARAAPRSRRPARGSPSGRAAAAAAARPRRAPTPATSAGATPLLLASPLMLTCRQTCSGGRCAGRCSLSRWAIFRRSTECTQSNCSATTRVLLLCSGPIRCHSSRGAQVGQRGDLLERLPARSSRRSGAAPAAMRLAHRVGAEGLAHRQQRDALHGASGGRAGAGDARVHLLELVCDHRHNAPRVSRRRRVAPARSRHPLPEDPWTSPNCWRSRSRTRPPTCTCRPACRR